MFEVILQDQAERDYEKHFRAGNTILRNKIIRLLEELKLHPHFGTGKPHQLKHRPDGTWSRRIDDRHRMIYIIDDNKVIVLVMSMWGHYDDK
jgi:toxin YoeB